MLSELFVIWGTDGDGDDGGVPTTLPSGQTPRPSRPGTKYAVQGNPSLRFINVYFCVVSTQTLVKKAYFKDGFNAVLPFPDAVKPAEGGKLLGELLSQCDRILAEGGIDVYLLLELAVFKLLLRGVDMVRFACLIVLRDGQRCKVLPLRRSS